MDSSGRSARRGLEPTDPRGRICPPGLGRVARRTTPTDTGGNTGDPASEATYTWNVDTTAPSVGLTAPANNSSTDATPDLSGAAGNATGDSNTVTVNIYAGPTATGDPVATYTPTRSGATWAVTAAALSDGTYTAKASQTDTAGNTGQSSANTFHVVTGVHSPATSPATSNNTMQFTINYAIKDGSGNTITAAQGSVSKV